MYEQTIEAIDETGNLVSHILDTIAFSSEKTIASAVLLLSTVPEFWGMVAATKSIGIAIATSAASFVLVQIALAESPARLRIPRIGASVPIYKFWLVYLLQLSAGVVWIIHSGMMIHICLIVFSFCAAVGSEEIAKVTKVQAKSRRAERLQAQRDRIRSEELRKNSELRIADKEAKFAEKWEVIEPAKEEAEIRIETASAEPSEKAIVTEESLKEARAKSRATVNRKVAERRKALAEQLVENPEVKNAELAQMFGVSAATIRADRKAMK